MKEPVAAKFLRAMISASSSARYSGEACRARSASKAAHEVALLVGRVAGLAQLVPARVAQDGHAVPVGRFRVVPQPGGRLHDVGVGVVDDPALGVGHVSLPLALRSCRGVRGPVFQACGRRSDGGGPSVGVPTTPDGGHAKGRVRGRRPI